jgi:hypothetical protein
MLPGVQGLRLRIVSEAATPLTMRVSQPELQKLPFQGSLPRAFTAGERAPIITRLRKAIQKKLEYLFRGSPKSPSEMYPPNLSFTFKLN